MTGLRYQVAIGCLLLLILCEAMLLSGDVFIFNGQKQMLSDIVFGSEHRARFSVALCLSSWLRQQPCTYYRLCTCLWNVWTVVHQVVVK